MKSVGLLRDGTEALVGVLRLVVRGVLDGEEGMMQQTNDMGQSWCGVLLNPEIIAFWETR